MAEVAPSDLVGSLMGAFVDSRCLHVAVNLGVPEAVSDEPRGLQDIAHETGVDASALGRVLRRLAALGIFAMRGDQVWHNDIIGYSSTKDPGGLAPLIRMMGLPVLWDSFGRLEDAVRTGRPGTTFVDPNGFFAYLDAHPDESALYDQGMTSMTTRRISRWCPVQAHRLHRDCRYRRRSRASAACRARADPRRARGALRPCPGRWSTQGH